MADYNAAGDFAGLAKTLKAPQYGEANPDVSFGQNKSARAMALQNAMRNLSMGDIGLQGKQQDLSNQERMYGLTSQEPGIMDWLSSIPSAYGAFSDLFAQGNKTKPGGGK